MGGPQHEGRQNKHRGRENRSCGGHGGERRGNTQTPRDNTAQHKDNTGRTKTKSRAGHRRAWAYHDDSFLEHGGVSGAAVESGVARESLRRRSRWEFHLLRMVLTLRDGSAAPGPGEEPAVAAVEGVVVGAAPTTAPGTRRDTPAPAAWGVAVVASVWEFSLILRRRTLGGRQAAAIRSPSPRGGRVRSAVHELRRRSRWPPLYFIILPTRPGRGRHSGHLKCFQSLESLAAPRPQAQMDVR